MLHASSYASWMPPSTKAAGDVKLSILAFSSVPDAIAKVPQPDTKSIKKHALRWKRTIMFSYSLCFKKTSKAIIGLTVEILDLLFHLYK
jgi:hypothetical protein